MIREMLLSCRAESASFSVSHSNKKNSKQNCERGKKDSFIILQAKTFTRSTKSNRVFKSNKIKYNILLRTKL